MKVTARGRAILAAGVGLAFCALLYQDVLILTALLVVVALVVGEAAWVWVVTRRPARWFSIYNEAAAGAEPLSISKALYPGESSHDDLRFLKKVGGEAALVSRLPSLKITPDAFKARGFAGKASADFKTPFAGRYSSDVIELAVTGPLRIISDSCTLPAKVTYSVRPRIVGAAITSAKLLGKGGAGESAVESPGAGTEFYGIGEYHAGESYRHINWNATARRGKLMTNELKREVGGAYYLVLEAVSPDYFDRDRLAATFLGMANALTMQGIRFGVVVHDGEKVKGVQRLDAPTVSLAFASKAALEFADLDRPTLEEELAPASSHALGSIRNLLAESGPTPLYQIEHLAMSQRLMSLQNQDTTRTILALVGENPGAFSSIIYVSGLFGPTEPVIGLGSSAKRFYGTDFVVANPTAPWVAAPDEESAYDAYSRYSRKTKALRNAGVDYQLGEPTSLVQRVISA